MAKTPALSAAAAPPAADTRSQILDTARRIIAGKGYAAVGLSELLTAAGVPKGSFYHWFRSKEQFGEALLERHFEAYLADVDATLGAVGMPAVDRLAAFFARWHATQTSDDPGARCLVVKLSAEVCDLSEPMRSALERGTAQVVGRLHRCLTAAVADGNGPPGLAAADAANAAQALYQQWLGATLMARVQRSPAPLDAALARTTRWIARPQVATGPATLGSGCDAVH